MEEVAPGKKLGRLEILSLIQSGEHGELYRALDSRTDQEVGVKVLPLVDGAEARFEKRHYSAARLRHPNVFAVQRLLSRPGISYVILEAIAGEPLRTLLKPRPMPMSQAIGIARQLAEGLESGHVSGIAHGALNPDTVFADSAGHVKILDFGFLRKSPLRKFAADKGGDLPLPENVEYLSPEQLRGEPATPSSDLFSLGSIFYELLMGQKAFRGQTPQERAKAVLNDMPDEPPARIPAPVVEILGRCLMKSPAERFASAAELRIALEDCKDLSEAAAPLEVPEPVAAPGEPRVSPFDGWKERFAATVAPLGKRVSELPLKNAALLAAAVLAALAFLWWASNGSMGGQRSGVPKFQRVTFRKGSIQRARFAGDGKTIVYTARFDGAPLATYAYASGDPDGRNLGLPEGSSLVSVSKKGDLAVRLATGALVRVPLAGGPPQQLAVDISDADWSPNGDSLAVARFPAPGGKYRLEYPLGTVLYESALPLELVRVSPDGKRVAFTEFDGVHRQLWVVSKPDNAKRLANLGSGDAQRTLSWAPDSSEVWFGSITPQQRGLIQAIGMGGRERAVDWMPESYLDDVSPTGRALVENLRSWSGVLLGKLDQAGSSDVSWHGQAVNMTVSPAGGAVFTEYGEGGGPNFGIYGRASADVPAVRIGDGDAVALSPDGRWVCALRPKGTPKYSLLSMTNPGEEKPVSVEGLEDKSAPVVGWLDNGDYLLWGRAPGKKPRHFVWRPRPSGGLRPVTPEGSPLGYPAADGSKILTGGSANGPQVYKVSDGSARPAAGLRSSDQPLRWASDGESVYVASLEADHRFAVLLVDLRTGERRRLQELRPGIQADTILPRSISPDGKTVGYSYYRAEADLFLADGLK
jgi:Tol biopolymer transport system component